MPEQPRDAIDDGETEAEPSLRALGAIGEPVKLLEHGFLIALGDAHARIDHLDRDELATAPAANEHAACARVAARITDEILQDAAQQCGVRTNAQFAGDKTQPQILVRERLGELGLERVEQFADPEVPGPGFQGCGIEARNVEQCAQQVLDAE